MPSLCRQVALSLLAAIALGQQGLAQSATTTEAESTMFAASNGYEHFMGRWSRQLAPAYIAFAGVRDGERVLDVGTGTGSLVAALEIADPGSPVIGVDPSADFIAYAKKSLGNRNVRFEVGDAQALAFGDATFDHTMALLVMNFIPDHEKALAEMRRVTRPRGVVSACVWDYDAGMQMLRIFWDEAVALDPAIEPRDERHMKLSRQGQLAALWKKTGLVDIREEAVGIVQEYASFGDYWEPFTQGAGPGGAFVLALPEPRRRQLEARLRRRLLGDRHDGAFTLKASAWCVRGEVPGS